MRVWILALAIGATACDGDPCPSPLSGCRAPPRASFATSPDPDLVVPDPQLHAASGPPGLTSSTRPWRGSRVGEAAIVGRWLDQEGPLLWVEARFRRAAPELLLETSDVDQLGAESGCRLSRDPRAQSSAVQALGARIQREAPLPLGELGPGRYAGAAGMGAEALGELNFSWTSTGGSGAFPSGRAHTYDFPLPFPAALRSGLVFQAGSELVLEWRPSADAPPWLNRAFFRARSGDGALELYCEGADTGSLKVPLEAVDAFFAERPVEPLSAELGYRTEAVTQVVTGTSGASASVSAWTERGLRF